MGFGIRGSVGRHLLLLGGCLIRRDWAIPMLRKLLRVWWVVEGSRGVLESLTGVGPVDGTGTTIGE